MKYYGRVMFIMIENESIDKKDSSIEFLKNTKIWIKKNRYSKNPIIKFLIESLYFLISILYTIKRIFTDKEYRALTYIKVFKSSRVQQTTPLTAMDRYPIIFSACKDYFDKKEDIKILSYGCSTGEEVLTLRKYFPTATIVGAEINKHSLEICRNLPVDEKITFINSTPKKIKKYGPFDIVFCMAVLQRTPDRITKEGITSLKKIYPFEKFEQQIVELDSYVNKGGLLVTHFTQYSFMDTTVSSKYTVLGNYNQDDYRSSIFDKNSNLIRARISRNSIFIKMEV